RAAARGPDLQVPGPQHSLREPEKPCSLAQEVDERSKLLRVLLERVAALDLVAIREVPEAIRTCFADSAQRVLEARRSRSDRSDRVHGYSLFLPVRSLKSRSSEGGRSSRTIWSGAACCGARGAGPPPSAVFRRPSALSSSTSACSS